MGDFSANSKFDPKKNFTEVKFGADYPLLETELNELQQIQNEARADIIRSMAHSGVMDFISGVRYGLDSTRANQFGEVQVPSDGQFSTSAYHNTFDVMPFNVVSNGSNILIEKFNHNISNRITLPEPPTYGTRDDLVFLEAWFEEISAEEDSSIIDGRIGEETSHRKKLNWRIRTVAGVDFEKYPEGLGIWGSEEYPVTPQGGNSSYILDNKSWTYGFSLKGKTLTGSTTSGKEQFSNDEGLYVSGNGTKNSKDTLKTADGYVYAIPLFRVKRRNSGGYREDNVNGSRDYFSTSLAEEYVANSFTMKLFSIDGLRVNDKIRLGSGFNDITVLSINKSTNTIGVDKSWGANLYVSYPVTLESDRPDGKYSNIIHEDDIIDLRHKVSLSGENYDKLLQENFDKLLRGELGKEEFAKERFGLTPAPLGMEKQLMPTTVNVPNFLDNPTETDPMKVEFYGVTRANLTKDFTKWGFSSNWTVNSSRKVTLQVDSTGYVEKTLNINVKPSTYYLIFLKNNTGSVYIEIDGVINGRETAYGTNLLKIVTNPDSTFVRVRLGNTGGNSGTFVFEDLRMYEIDQATYDKIGDLSEEQVEAMFPYVSSYPNVVENLITPFAEWDLHDNATVVSPYELRLDATGNFQDNTLTIPAIANQAYTLILGNAVLPSSSYFFVKELDENGSGIKDNTIPVGNNVKTFITGANAKQLKIYIGNSKTGTFTFSQPMLTLGSEPRPFVPFGRWLLPYDYANGDTPTRISDVQGENQRRTWSDKQISEVVKDVISPVSNKHLPHVSTSQATEGEWAVGDTITIKSNEGVITGIIDSDTALAKVVEDSNTSFSVKLDSVEGLSVGDSFNLINPTTMEEELGSIYVETIDASSNTITMDSSESVKQGWLLVESTASSSAPVYYSDSTWTFSGLGTKEVTMTCSGLPTDVNEELKVAYSVNYPSGKGIENLPTEIFAGEVNGIEYEKSSKLKLKADFRGKVSGNTDGNPHNVKVDFANSLLQPSSIRYEYTTSDYRIITKQDSSVKNNYTNVDGQHAQALFSFNIVEEVERQYGVGIFGGALTLEEKVQWCKDNINKIVANWYGYGSSHTGNKANLRYWASGSSVWSKTIGTHTSDTVSRIFITATPSNDISSDGEVHFLTYAEPSDGETPSTIYTDYIDLDIELNVGESGYEVLVPKEPFNVLVDSPSVFKEGENLIPPFTDTRWDIHSTGEVISASKLIMDSTNVSQNTALELSVEPNKTYTMSYDRISNEHVVIQSIDDNGSSSVITTLITSDFATFSTTHKKIRINASSNGNSTGLNEFNSFMLVEGDEPKPFVPYNKDVKRKKKFDFRGKIVGSTFENPHRMGIKEGTDFWNPSSTFYEADKFYYSDISKKDGILRKYAPATNGYYGQHVFEFDLSHLGLSLKELKSALRRLTVNWTGYGVGDNAGVKSYGARIKVWNSTSSSWIDYNGGVESVPKTTSLNYATSYLKDIETKDQKVYILVHSTYPAGTASPSEIYTDYISLDVELAEYVDSVKKNVVKVRPVTKELKLSYPRFNEKTGREDEIELFYNHKPQFSPIEGTEEVTILAESDGFLVSDLSTSVGDKQGTHHYLNPLYKVGNNPMDVFGEFGFGRVPFASDNKGVNIGSVATLVNAGFSSITHTRQYGLKTIEKPMVGISRYLVLQEGELKLFIYSVYSNRGEIQTDESGVGLLIPLIGKPLVKESKGITRIFINPTAWKTPTGEIQGYLNEDGEVIATYQ
jgi:hypothetical protein